MLILTTATHILGSSHANTNYSYTQLTLDEMYGTRTQESCLLTATFQSNAEGVAASATGGGGGWH